ncbi:MAG TPA: hypothetical protein VN929_09030 [Burkholderiales bacterium]|nr:hypothetical protein [Burkholderiales bacterium]
MAAPVGPKKVHRYTIAEFTFSYDHRELSDGERTVLAIKQAQGKRLKYAELTGQVSGM